MFLFHFKYMAFYIKGMVNVIEFNVLFLLFIRV